MGAQSLGGRGTYTVAIFANVIGSRARTHVRFLPPLSLSHILIDTMEVAVRLSRELCCSQRRGRPGNAERISQSRLQG